MNVRSLKGRDLAAKKKPPEENWPTVFKAIALKTIATGKFWQLGWFVVMGLLIWRIESADLVEIARLFVESPVYSILGWVLFAATSLVSVLVFRVLRNVYSGELERVVAERNELQSQLTNGNVASSKPTANLPAGKKS